MGDFVKVGTVDEVPEGEMKGWEVNGVLVGVANVDGTYYPSTIVAPTSNIG